MNFLWEKEKSPPKEEKVILQSGVEDTRVQDVEDSVAYCDKTATTCFIETESKVEETFSASGTTSKYDDRFQSVKDFLAKPQLLQSTLWANANIANTDLYNVDPSTLLTSVAQWQNKLYGFNLVSGKFHLRVELNANPFQQGALLLHWRPYINSTDTVTSAIHDHNLIIRSMHPHVIMLASDGVAEIDFPLLSPYTMYSRYSACPTWGKIYVTVFCPLASGATGPTDAEISIYGWWTDVSLAAPIVPQAGKKDKELVSAGGPISRGLSLVGKAAGSFAEVPILSAIAKPVEWVANAASGIASIFGFSKVDNNLAPAIVAKQINRYSATSDGQSNEPPLSVLSQNAIEQTDSHTIYRQDEMVIKDLVKRPAYVTTLTWATTDASDSPLYSTRVAPNQFNTQYTKTAGSKQLTIAQGGPLFYYGSSFRLYRGSIVFRLQFIKTGFHTGKLQFTFTPLAAAGYTAPTTSTSLLSYRVILDVSQRDFVEFVCPYELAEPYLSTSTSMGLFEVRVLNQLRCPETCSQSISALVFVYAGEDFEFNKPGIANYGPTGTADYGAYPLPATLQSGSSDKIYSGPLADVNMPAKDELYYAKACVGEVVTSLKQLAMRHNRVLSGQNQTMSAGALVYPWSFGYIKSDATGLIFPQCYGDFFPFLMAPFRFFSGSMRLMVLSQVDEATNKYLPASFVNLSRLPSSNKVVSSVASGYGAFPGANNEILSEDRFQGVHISDVNTSSTLAKVPYWNSTPVSFTTPELASGVVNRDYGTPDTVAEFYAPGIADFTVFHLFRATGDDFRVSMFYGCPPLYVAINNV